MTLLTVRKVTDDIRLYQSQRNRDDLSQESYDNLAHTKIKTWFSDLLVSLEFEPDRWTRIHSNIQVRLAVDPTCKKILFLEYIQCKKGTSDELYPLPIEIPFFYIHGYLSKKQLVGRPKGDCYIAGCKIYPEATYVQRGNSVDMVISLYLCFQDERICVIF